MSLPRLSVAAALGLALSAPVSAGPDAQASPDAARRVSIQTNAPAKPFGDPARALAPPAADDAFVLSAPPRESPEEGARLYQPIAEYLSRATGRTVVYRHPGNWLTYQTEMVRGGYDLVFDGPHFTSWRIANQRYHTLAKLGDEHRFAVIVRKDDAQITELRQLTGKKVCAMNPPNLGTLAFLGEFDNPVRQPVLVDSVGWEGIYQGVVSERRCLAGILPVANLSRYDKDGTRTRVIHRSRLVPNQAFSAGPRIPRSEQVRFAAALLAPEAQEATARLRAAYGSERGLVPAAPEEYAGLDVFLKDVWGYGR